MSQGSLSSLNDTIVTTSSSSTSPFSVPSYKADREEHASQFKEKYAKLKKRNNVIDHLLESERRSQEKMKATTKMLLLGQPGSGRSTLLRNFRLTLSPKTFQADLPAWRVIIYLSICRTINSLVDIIQHCFQSHCRLSHAAHEQESTEKCKDYMTRFSSPSYDELRRLTSRLRPLWGTELFLRRLLQTKDLAAQPACDACHCASCLSTNLGDSLSLDLNWRATITGVRGSLSAFKTELVEAAKAIRAADRDIQMLLSHPQLLERLRDQRILLEQHRLFLDDLERVTDPSYVPSPDDVLRVQSRTTGVEEHFFAIESDDESKEEWIIYSIACTRSHRAAWIPFFDNVSLIIFVASVSAFNEFCGDKRQKINCLEDSLDLWSQICSSSLLQHIPLILLLNKCDVLEAKLLAGVKFKQFSLSYPESEPNTLTSVQQFIERRFIGILKSHSRVERKFQVHFTSATDVAQTSNVLTQIHDLIFVRNLYRMDII